MDLTVLALHGLTSTTKVWGSLAAALPQARIVAPDLAGRGSAAERRTAPGLTGHADDVVRLADDLGLDGVVLVGHSMGAFLAPLVAARLGPRVTEGAAARRRRRTGTVHIGQSSGRRATERADANHLTLLFDPSVPKAIV